MIPPFGNERSQFDYPLHTTFLCKQVRIIDADSDCASKRLVNKINGLKFQMSLSYHSYVLMENSVSTSY